MRGADQRLDQREVRVRILLGPGLGDAEHLLRIVLPDLVVGDHRHAHALEDGLLVPGLADAVAVDRAGLERRRHLRRRRHRDAARRRLICPVTSDGE